jgi:hypothetical protein
LEPVLGPLAEEYNADLYLAAGEQTDSRLYTVARDADEDGRELVVFVFADCDPAGWQMAVSIAHKLRAFKEMFFPDLEFQVHAPALTVDQVRDLNLPSTPLKPTEKRASQWRAAFGVEQTEIDALASLNPDALRQIAREAVAPFFDDTLEERIEEARAEWTEQAQDQIDAAAKRRRGYARLRQDAASALTKARKAVTALQRETVKLVPRRDLPEFEMPEAEPDNDGPEPLISSDMPLEEHIEVLRARKRYTNGEE